MLPLVILYRGREKGQSAVSHEGANHDSNSKKQSRLCMERKHNDKNKVDINVNLNNDDNDTTTTNNTNNDHNHNNK